MKVIILLIVYLSIFSSIQAQDTLVFNNKKIIETNIRKLEFRGDLVKVPQIEENVLLYYNYLSTDFDMIISSDSSYIFKILAKNDFDEIFYFRKNGKLYSHTNLNNERHENELKKANLKKQETKNIKIETTNLKKIRKKKEKNNIATHDLGFMMFCSFGSAERMAPKPAYKEI